MSRRPSLYLNKMSRLVTSRVLMTPVIRLVGKITIDNILLCGGGGGGHRATVLMEAALAGAAPGGVVRVTVLVRLLGESDLGGESHGLGCQGISRVLPPHVSTARRRT